MVQTRIDSRGNIMRSDSKRKVTFASQPASFLARLWRWFPRLAAIGVLAFVLNPSAESFTAFLSHRSSWTLTALRRSSYNRELFWSTASSGKELFFGCFGMWVAIPSFFKSSPDWWKTSATTTISSITTVVGGLDESQLLTAIYVLIFSLCGLGLAPSAMFWQRHFMVSRPNLRSWRFHTLITSSLSHCEIMHLLMNLSTLTVVAPLVAGRLAQQYGQGPCGSLAFWLLYFTAAIGGSAASLCWHPSHYQSLGASGALFGLYGFLATTAPDQQVLWFGQELTVSQGLVASLALGHLSESFANGATDTAMHIGGALTGAYLFPKIIPHIVETSVC